MRVLSKSDPRRSPRINYVMSPLLRRMVDCFISSPVTMSRYIESKCCERCTQQVLNTGTAATTGWRVNFSFTAGQTISQIWGGTRVQTGSAVVVSNETWNGQVAPGAGATSGFLGSWTSSNPIPSPVTCTAL